MRRAVLDSSTLISLARSGLLPLLGLAPLELVVLDSVVEEAVAQGRVNLHADSFAIEAALDALGLDVIDAPTARSIDDAVLQAAVEAGVLLTNDLTLGRRARNLGARWLRTADLVVMLVRRSIIDASRGRAAIISLRDSARITDQLAHDYLEELQ